MHFDKLCVIDIAAARKHIVARIEEDRIHARLAAAIEKFVLSLHGKTVNRSVAAKLTTFLAAECPGMKIGPVQYVNEASPLNMGLVNFRLKVKLYDVEQDERSFWVREQREYPGAWDIDNLMVPEQLWTRNADHLEASLADFTTNARRFNSLVENLKDFATLAELPNSHHAVYPLTSLFHYFQLKG